MRGVPLFDYGVLIIGFCVALFFVMVVATASELALAQQPLPHPAPHVRPATTSVAVAPSAYTASRQVATRTSGAADPVRRVALHCRIELVPTRHNERSIRGGRGGPRWTRLITS